MNGNKNLLVILVGRSVICKQHIVRHVHTGDLEEK